MKTLNDLSLGDVLYRCEKEKIDIIKVTANDKSCTAIITECTKLVIRFGDKRELRYKAMCEKYVFSDSKTPVGKLVNKE